MDFDEKLIAKIKGENIAPRPRWHFLLKDYAVWVSGALSLLVGGAAISVIIYLLKYDDAVFRVLPRAGWWEIILLTLPYFWLLFLGLFIFILYYNLKHTQRGYRYPVWLIISASIVMSGILGGVFHSLGLGERIDRTLGRRAPFYDRVFNPQVDFWSRPEEGRLAGLVSGREGRYISLVDRNREAWIARLAIGDGYPEEFIAVGEPVHLVGKIAGDHQFIAERVLPAGPGRDFFRRFEGGRPMPMPKPMIIFVN